MPGPPGNDPPLEPWRPFEAGPAPRVVGGARSGQRVAWIDANGAVTTAAPGHALRALGESEAALLGISPEGDQIAWLSGGRLQVAGADDEDPRSYPAPADTAHLEWRDR